jgi:hypothetical protein
MRKNAPGALEADVVAELTLKALGKKPIVIPGKVNKAACFVMTRLMTRKAAIALMLKNTKELSLS